MKNKLKVPTSNTVGIIEGHTLISGNQGSGISTFITNIAKDILMSNKSEFIDEIIIIQPNEDSLKWSFLEGHRKVRIYKGRDEALRGLKDAHLKMKANSKWNTLNGKENTDFGQTLVFIDDINYFNIELNDISNINKQIAKKSIEIIDILALQSRNANLFIYAEAYKSTLNQLSGTFRSNAMNRILLKSDKISSVVVIDEEIQNENGIDSQKLTSGQFIYWNRHNGLINQGFAVEDIEWDLEKANAIKDNPILIKGREETNSLIEGIIKEIHSKQTKKTTYNLSNIVLDKLDEGSDKLNITKTKILEVLIRKIDFENYEDEFAFYNLKVK
jgi:hypothetical protein